MLQFREIYGDDQRQAWTPDHSSLPAGAVLQLLGDEGVPVLQEEVAGLRVPGGAAAPTHATLVRAKCSAAAPHQPRPHANSADNATRTVPGHHRDPATPAWYPVLR